MTNPARLERLVHGVFIAGLVASAALIFAGVVRVLVGGVHRPPEAPTLHAIVTGALKGDPLGWLYAGLVALMLMPIVRVFLLAAGFARQKEWRFGLAALIVLLFLLASLRLGTR